MSMVRALSYMKNEGTGPGDRPTHQPRGLQIRFSNSRIVCRHSFSISLRISHEFCRKYPAQHQRAQGMPGAWCARSRAWCVVNTRVSHHGHTGNTRHSPRNGFNGFLRTLPGDRACLSPSPADHSANLTPASGRQDHTTSPSACARPRQKRRPRPSHPAPRP
jgi:hypothetical protein